LIIYSVTVSIDGAIEHDWLVWMRDHHIPEVIATGYFVSHSMRRVTEPSDVERPSYNIEYTCESLEQLQTYQQNHAPALQQDHTERYAGRFSASRTIHEIL
jgi:hypothetical protein